MAVWEMAVVAPEIFDSPEAIRKISDQLIAELGLVVCFYTPPVWPPGATEPVCMPIRQSNGTWPLRFVQLDKNGKLKWRELAILKKKLRDLGFVIVGQWAEGNNLPKGFKKDKIRCRIVTLKALSA